MELTQLLDAVRDYSGVQSKHALQQVLGKFSSGTGDCQGFPNGDDTAVIPHQGGFNLFAMEGFISEFVEHDPWFAGWCGVMVNCSDIAAMGGSPVAVTNAIWSQDDNALQQIMQGINDAAEAYGVPVVGGHTCQQAPSNQLSVAIVGHTERVLSSFEAQPGHVLVCAIDLRGRYQQPFLNWNAATTAPAGQLQQDIALLPKIAQLSGVSGAKDISQAGLLGTTTMFMDCSGCGVDIELEQIPKPSQVSWVDWLRSFPSFGYLISCTPETAAEVIDIFQQCSICAAQIGTLNSSGRINVIQDNRSAEFWDLNQHPFMVPGKSNETSCHESSSHMPKERAYA